LEVYLQNKILVLNGIIQLNQTIASVILGILIVGAVLYFSLNSNNLNQEITNEFSLKLNSLVNDYSGVSIKNVNVINTNFGALDGSVNLDCGNLSYEERRNFIEDFSNFIFTQYPEHFGESATYSSSVRIFCSDSEGESWTVLEGMSLPDEY
jgi:hypothetical protein